MKHTLLALIAVLGFATGWGLTREPDPPPDATPTLASVDYVRREHRQRALLERLLGEYELTTYRSRTAPLAELLAMGSRESRFPEEDIARMVALDPAAAMDTLLANPVAPWIDAEHVAAEWARQQPEAAIRYLQGKKSYRAEDCLAEALPAAYLTQPQLVGEVIRSKSRDWQERHLHRLFGETYQVRKPGALPPPEPDPDSDDPFSHFEDDDGHWTTVRFGTDLLDCLADDELREQARTYWEPHKDEAPRPTAKEETWDAASYDNKDYRQFQPLLNDFNEKRDETVAQVVAHGNPAARRAVMSIVVARFPNDPKQWAQGLETLETSMTELGVIPETLPSHFEMGPFLHGPEVAGWIDRQPLALRRAWAPDFVETWAQKDPAEAMDWAEALPEEASREQAFQTGLVVWTHRDPLAATARVESLPPGDLREAAISNAAATWNCIDPAAARKWVESLPVSPGQTRALERLGR